MLLKRQVLDDIVIGKITVVFRRWKRPTVKTGGLLRTSAGVLAIDSVEAITDDRITKIDAQRAGFSSVDELLAATPVREQCRLYRVQLRYAGPDPRNQLRQQDSIEPDEIIEIQTRLGRMDTRSTIGSWTAKLLKLIEQRPGTRAADLADSLRWETKAFKAKVRKLKELGLTESLQVGYRLSPRGKAVLRELSG